MTDVLITERELQSFERKAAAWLETLDEAERAIFNLLVTRAMDADDVQGFGIGGTIEVESYSWGVSQGVVGGSSSSGAGAGKVKFNELVVTKKTDVASPAMFRSALGL